MQEVVRTHKCGLKVKTKVEWESLLIQSKAATGTYNFATMMVNGDDAHRQESIDRQLTEWKQQHPVEAALYDAAIVEYQQYKKVLGDAKRGKCPYPDVVDYPKMPVKIKSEVKSRLDKVAVRDIMAEMIESYAPTFKVGDSEYPLNSIRQNVAQIIIGKVDGSVKGTITRRTQGYRAGLPQPKPAYADTPFYFYKPFFHVERTEHEVKDKLGCRTCVVWTLCLKLRENADPHGVGILKLRFFPNIEGFDPDKVKSVQIGRVRGKSKWWVCFGMRKPVSHEPLPDRTLGVDINSGYGNHVVVSDPNGEIFRRTMPESLGKILKRIERLQARKNAALNVNGEKYDTNKVRKLSRAIARLHNKAANVRKNALHHISKEIVHSGNVISMEDLDVQQITKSAKGVKGRPGKNVSFKALCNRRMLSVAPGMFREMVTYKSHGLANSTMKVVEPAGTSKNCNMCGQEGHRKGHSFWCRNSRCSVYGVEVDADTNAGRNIAKIAAAGKGTVVERPQMGGLELAQVRRRQKKEEEKVAQEAQEAQEGQGVRDLQAVAS